MANEYSQTPAKTSLSRVFLIDGRARGDHAESYEACLKMTGLSQAFGDITKIECPDPNAYGRFVEVGQIRGASERAKTTLQGRYALDLKSKLLKMARKGCAIDVQLHMGSCEDPRNFNTFQKAIILEDVVISTMSTEDLGALASGEDKSVNETADLSSLDFYEVVPLTFAEKAASIVTNEVVDGVLCDALSCGECAVESDGCKKYIAVTKSAGGSPSTPADVVFTVDGGTTWYAYDINALSAVEDPVGVDCVGNYCVVISFNGGCLAYTLKSTLSGLVVPTFTKVTTGFVAKPSAIASYGSGAFIVGEQGYVYLCTDPTAGVTVLSAGTATADRLYGVSCLGASFAVAVGGNSAIIYTQNGTTWQAAPSAPTGVAINYYTVLCKSELEWWIGASNGKLYYTTDAGVSWHEKAFSGSGSGVVRDIIMATKSVMYMSHDTATPRARIFRSFDGGYSWIACPELTGTLPSVDRINTLSACSIDPNLVFAGGLHDNGTDGVILVGAGG